MKAVNVALINLYWEVVKSIAEKQSESWGKSIVPTFLKITNEFLELAVFRWESLVDGSVLF